MRKRCRLSVRSARTTGASLTKLGRAPATRSMSGAAWPAAGVRFENTCGELARRSSCPRFGLRGGSGDFDLGQAEVLERLMAVVLPQEIQETPVVARRHVEQLDEHAVI